jgi:cell division protein FtsB
VIGQEQIAQAKTEIQNLKKQKQKINDEVLELNIKTEVPLTNDVVATLQAEGLI